MSACVCQCVTKQNLGSRHLLLGPALQSLGYGAGCVCTQTLFQDSTIKKTSIQKALRTTCRCHTLLALYTHRHTDSSSVV